MNSTGHLPELESLRSQVADLARELAERDHAMQARQQDIDCELQDLRKQSDLLRTIMQGTGADTGDEFFASLATHLTSTLHMQYAVIGEILDGTPASIRTLAASSEGHLLDNFEYDLAQAPCRTGLTESFWCFPQGVQTLFPNFPLLATMGVESHSGVSIRNKQGKVVGLIVVMDTKPIAHQDRLQTLLEVFAPRVAAELQRKQAEHEHRQALHELQNITETVPDIMFTLDTQGNMVKWNHRVEEVTGYFSKELHGTSALAFVPVHEQEQTARAIQRAFTEGKAELEGHLLTKDQRTIPYHWTGAALKNSQGRIIGITGIGRDVSAQKQAAEALRRQRQHLLEAQALAHLGSWEWDIESGETDWSEEQFRIFGHEPGAIAVTYDTFLAALLPDDHDRVLAAVNDALLGTCPLDLECRIVRPNGDIRVIHMRADVQRDATAHPIGMAGTALDITERKHTEEALRTSEERWHLAVQGSNDGIWDWNIQAGEIFFSARWKTMRGFADHEVSNHIDEWRSRIHPDDLDRVLQSVDRYLAKQTSAFCEEYRVQRKDGSYMWILDRGVALWAEDGTPLRMAGSETDITENKRARSLLEATTNSIADGLLTIDRQGNVASVNRRFLEMWRIPQDLAALREDGPLLAFALEQLTYPEVFRAKVQELYAHPEQESCDVLLFKDGRVFERYSRPQRLDDEIVGRVWSFHDVTAGQKMEAALRESQERFSLAAEGSTDALWDAHPNPGEPWYAPQTSIWWSPRIRELLGLEEGERFETLDQWAARLHPDDKDRVFGQLAAHIEHRVPYDAEYRLRTERGDYLWVRGRGQAMWDEQGTPRRMSGSCQDITERKRAEEALRESEERYRTLVELSPSGVFVFSEGRTVYVNSTAVAILGAAEPNEILERSPFDFIHPDYHEDVTKNLRRVLAGEATVHRAERVYLKMDGTPIHVQVEAVRITWNGKPAIQGFFADITERKRAEEAVTRSYDLMRSFVEHTPAAVAMLDNDLRYVAVSRRWLQDYRLGDQELVGKRHYDVFPEISAMQEWREIHQRCLNGAVERREEDRFVRADGSEDWTRWEVRPWQDVTGRTGGIIMYTEVITERKRAEEALRASEERLRLSLEAANQGIYDLNVQTGEAHVSPGYATMLGYDPGSFRETNANWIARLHPHERTRVQTDYRDYIEGKTAEYRVEFRQRAQNGEWRWILSLGRIVEWSAKGEPLRMLGTHTDITERKQAEEALRDTNYMLQALIETSPLAIIGLDQDGTNVTRWNPAAEKIFGWRAADVLGHPLPYIPAEDQTRSFAIWEETTQTGVLTGKELQRQRKDGSLIDVAFWSTALKDAQGTVTGTFAFIADITDRKRTEEALIRSERQLRTVLDTLPIGVWFTDEKGHVLYGNPVGHRIWAEAARVGLPRPGDDGLWWETIDNIESLHRWAVSTVLARGHGVQNETLAIETRTGERRTIRNSAVPVKNDTGEMLGAIVLNEDITDRVRAENALHQEHALLMAVMDAATDIIFVKDLEGRYIHINRAGARTLGMAGEEVIGWNDYAIWPSDLAASCQLADRRVFETGEPVTVEETSVCNGVTTIYLTTKAPYRNSEGQIIGVIGVARDITERKRAEQALRDSEERYRSLVDGAPIGIYVNEHGLFSYLNKEMVRILKADCAEDLVGTPVMERIAPDYHQVVRERIQTLLTGHKPVPPLDERYVCTDGSQVDVAVTAIPAPFGGATAMQVLVLDITERKRAEEALRASEERFAKAFRSSPYPIVISELESGLFIDANDAAYQAFGYQREDVTNRTSTDFHLWPTPDHRMRFVEELQQAGAIRNVEIDLRMQNGELRHCLVSAEQIELHGKRCMVTVGTDVTEQKRAEEALREQHALLSAIMNTTMDIIFVKDLQGHYLHMNPAGARVVGLSPQEIVGKNDNAIWPADLAACCKEADRQILATGCTQTMEESTLANGKRTTYLTTKAPYRDAAGHMIGIIGVAHDISQIKQSEEDLRRSHAFIRQIIDTDPNFIFAKDREGRFTLVNKAVAEAYGTTVERLVGKTDADFNSNTRELAFFRKTDLEVMDSLHEQFIPEEMITDSAGHTRWLQTVKRPILDESGKAAMVLGASTDITERKRIEETLRQRERDLRTALDERERISQDLHDGILQSLYAVGLGLEACKPLMTRRHYKKAAASMDRAIGHLNHVMSEVRNFIAGLESQILQGSTFPIALRTMVQALTTDHPIPCTLMIDERLADTFSTEQALHLLNVVREALSNSLRHSGATKTTVSLKSLSRSIRLTIADNGRGFNPASMHGAGHGLTNMEARARKVGGRFAIRSVPQHGTRITIDLPKRSTEGD